MVLMLTNCISLANEDYVVFSLIFGLTGHFDSGQLFDNIFVIVEIMQFTNFGGGCSIARVIRSWRWRRKI